MTLFDEATAVLPPADSGSRHEPTPSRPFPVTQVVILSAVLITIAVALVLIAEGIVRADLQRSVAAQTRAEFSLPESQHVGVDIEGPAILQSVVNHFARIDVDLPNVPLLSSSGDLTATMVDAHRDGEQWMWDRMSGVVSLGAAQATSLFVPEEARTVLQLGFREADLTLDVAFSVAGTRVPMEIAVTPRFEIGQLSMTLSSATLGDKTVSAEELQAQLGPEGVSAVQLRAVCIADALPRFMTVRDASVRDQHLVMDVDIDEAAVTTAEGRQPGTCA